MSTSLVFYIKISKTFFSWVIVGIGIQTDTYVEIIFLRFIFMPSFNVLTQTVRQQKMPNYWNCRLSKYPNPQRKINYAWKWFFLKFNTFWIKIKNLNSILKDSPSRRSLPGVPCKLAGQHTEDGFFVYNERMKYFFFKF